MSQFIWDTNICIFYLKNVPIVHERVREHGDPKIFISEITLAELMFGVVKSHRPKHHGEALAGFLKGAKVLGVRGSLDIYATEKARLRKAGEPIDNFDLLIGATAIHHDLILVTNNTRHFQRLQGIKLEDWTK